MLARRPAPWLLVIPILMVAAFVLGRLWDTRSSDSAPEVSRPADASLSPNPPPALPASAPALEGSAKPPPGPAAPGARPSPDPHVVAVAGTTTVRGRFRVASGPAWETAFVWLLADTGGGVDPATLTSRGQFTSASPAFEYSGIAPGRYVIGAGLALGRVQTSHAIEVGSQPVEVELVVPPLADSQFVSVTARGPDGQVLESVGVGVVLEDIGYTAGSGTSVRDADGTWRVPLMATETAISGRGSIAVSAEGYGTRRVPIASPPQRRIEVRFEQPATLDVTLGSLDGPEVAEGLLGVVMVPEGPVDPPSVVNGSLSELVFFAGGKRRLGPVQPGDYVVHLVSAASRNSSAPWSVARETITLRPGNNTLRLAEPRLATLQVRSPGGASGWFSLERASILPVYQRDTSVSVGTDGVAVFPRLAPGRYVLAYRVTEGDPVGEMSVEVSAPGDEVVWKAGLIDGLRVALGSRSGRLTEAGLSYGDVIVAIDGREFRTSDDATALVRAAARRATFAVMLERAGKRVTLDVTPHIFDAESTSGGLLERVTR